MRVISWRIWGKCDTFPFMYEIHNISFFYQRTTGKALINLSPSRTVPCCSTPPKLSLPKRSGYVSPVHRESPVCRSQFPHPRKYAQRLTELPVWSILLQSPASGTRWRQMLWNALWRTCSPSPTFIQGARKPAMVGSLKSVNGNPTRSPQGSIFLTEYMQWYRWSSTSKAV